VARGGGLQKHLALGLVVGGLEVEVGEDVDPQQAEAALAVADALAGEAAEDARGGAVGPAPERGHLGDVAHAVAENNFRAGALGGLDEPGDVVGVVLAVAVEEHDGIEVVAADVVEAGADGGALAEVALVDDDDGAGGLGEPGGVVAGAVVHDEDFGDVRRAAAHDTGDVGGFVVGRDECADLHGVSRDLRLSPPPLLRPLV